MEKTYEAHFTTFLSVKKFRGISEEIRDDLIVRTKEICPEAILREDDHNLIYDGYCHVSLDEIRAWHERTDRHFVDTYFHLPFCVDYAIILEGNGERLSGYVSKDGVMLYDDVTFIPWEQITISPQK